MTFVYSGETHQKFLQYLLGLRDEKFKNFTERLLVTKYKVIGIKVPILKSLAINISQTHLYGYLTNCSFEYYEEVLIYGLLFSKLKNADKIIDYYNLYAQKIDSWGFTDTVIASLKIVKSQQEKFIPLIENLFNGLAFSVRSAYVFLLDYFVCDKYIDYVFSKLYLQHDNYYVNMAKAWLVSVIYLKYPQRVKSFLRDCQDKFVVNKSISKIRDSLRVADKDKKELLAYKR